MSTNRVRLLWAGSLLYGFCSVAMAQQDLRPPVLPRPPLTPGHVAPVASSLPVLEAIKLGDTKGCSSPNSGTEPVVYSASGSGYGAGANSGFDLYGEPVVLSLLGRGMEGLSALNVRLPNGQLLQGQIQAVHFDPPGANPRRCLSLPVAVVSIPLPDVATLATASVTLFARDEAAPVTGVPSSASAPGVVQPSAPCFDRATGRPEPCMRAPDVGLPAASQRQPRSIQTLRLAIMPKPEMRESRFDLSRAEGADECVDSITALGRNLSSALIRPNPPNFQNIRIDMRDRAPDRLVFDIRMSCPRSQSKILSNVLVGVEMRRGLAGAPEFIESDGFGVVRR